MNSPGEEGEEGGGGIVQRGGMRRGGARGRGAIGI